MRLSNRLGTMLKASGLAVALFVSACERRSSSDLTDQTDSLAARNDIEEMNELIDGVKNHPSLQPGSNEAGPPIHVDPYPHSKGMTHGNMTGMSHDEHPANSTDEH